MKTFNKKLSSNVVCGFSAIEMVIVVAVVAILVAVALPSFNKIKENQVMKRAVTDVLSSIDKARSETLSSLNSSEYGVHFQSDNVVIFKGQTYSSGASDNESIDIVAPATISNVTLAGSSSTSGDFYFSRLSAAPSKTGAITISTTSISKIVTIGATGVASSN